MLSDPRPVVICYYFHYLPGNWVWLQFLCAVKIWGDLPITTTIVSRCGEKAARQQGFSGAFLQNIQRKKKTVIEMCVGLCSYILRPSETSISKLGDNFNLFWNFEHTLSSYSMHTDSLTLCTKGPLSYAHAHRFFILNTQIFLYSMHTHRGRAALLESALQDTLGRFTVKLPSWKELMARFSKSDV